MKRRLFWIVLWVLALCLALPGTAPAAVYNTGDIAVVNAMLTSNPSWAGLLGWTRANSNGNSDPKWGGVFWSSSASDKRIRFIHIANKNLEGTLNVSGLTSLVWVDCSFNNLVSLNASGCAALEWLWCHNNRLTSLNVSGSPALAAIDCYSNKLTSLSVAGLNELVFLDCSYNEMPGKSAVIGYTGAWNPPNFTFDPQNAPVITITTQPTAATTVTQGSIAGSLSVAATVTRGAALSYRWHSNTTNSNTGGTAISGATSARFTIPATLAAGTYYYFCEVRAASATSVRSRVARVTVSAAKVAPTISGPTAMGLVAGYESTSTGEYTLTGTAPVTVTKTSGHDNITWNNATRKLDIASGLPEGTYPVELKAGNGIPPDATLTFTLTVTATAVAPGITTHDLPSGTVGTDYNQTIDATGTSPITWSIEDGSLPDGLTLSDAGVISGIPVSAGTFGFTVSAANSVGTDVRALSITIVPYFFNPAPDPDPNPDPDPGPDPDPSPNPDPDPYPIPDPNPGGGGGGGGGGGCDAMPAAGVGALALALISAFMRKKVD
jgi:hypothetical protein